MPVFDQPDLKAPWTLRAIVPEDWTVIANDRESETHNNEESKNEVRTELQGVADLFGQKELF